VRIFDPVYVEDGVVLEHSTIGPNVSIGAGARVVHSLIRDAVIGRRARIEHSALHDSMLGEDVVVAGVRGAVTLGSNSEVVSGEG
jgi:glucose-1-phosphate thymidylyltransferase